MASLFKRRQRSGKLSSQWWASWKDHSGKFKSRSTGTADEDVARIVANDWEKQDLLYREGHRERVERYPLPDLLRQYEQKLTAAGNTQAHVDETVRMIQAISDPAGWKLATDISARRVTSFLVELKNDGRKPRTIQKYIRAANGFTRWLVETGKLPANPLASIKAPTPGKGNRRMLLPTEWPHLESATAAADRFGMPGDVRVLLYRMAIETGLRANELRSLTRASLVLDATQPYVVATAGSTKNRKRAQQYVGLLVAAGLRALVSRKTPTAPLFELPAKWQMADMIREDLAAAVVTGSLKLAAILTN